MILIIPQVVIYLDILYGLLTGIRILWLTEFDDRCNLKPHTSRFIIIMTVSDRNIESSFECKHNRTAIRTIALDCNSPGEKELEIHDKLICLDCGEEVEFSPTIFVPDSFLISLHHK